MLTSEYMSVVNDVEAKFPVDEWEIDGIHIWPLIRIDLFFRVFEATQTETRNSRSSIFSGLGDIVKGYGSFLAASLVDRRNNARIDKKITALFLSDGVSYTVLGGKAYEKFCDPMIDRLEAIGVSCSLLNPSRNYYRPRYRPSRFIQPRLDAIRMMVYAKARLGRYTVERRLPKFDTAMDFLEERLPIRRMPQKEL